MDYARMLRSRAKGLEFERTDFSAHLLDRIEIRLKEHWIECTASTLQPIVSLPNYLSRSFPSLTLESDRPAISFVFALRKHTCAPHARCRMGLRFFWYRLDARAAGSGSDSPAPLKCREKVAFYAASSCRVSGGFDAPTKSRFAAGHRRVRGPGSFFCPDWVSHRLVVV